MEYCQPDPIISTHIHYYFCPYIFMYSPMQNLPFRNGNSGPNRFSGPMHLPGHGILQIILIQIHYLYIFMVRFHSGDGKFGPDRFSGPTRSLRHGINMVNGPNYFYPDLLLYSLWYIYPSSDAGFPLPKWKYPVWQALRPYVLTRTSHIQYLLNFFHLNLLLCMYPRSFKPFSVA